MSDNASSGANFAVAETGTIAVVESEGNGRTRLTLPQTLITVMGIEKVILTFQDMEAFLQQESMVTNEAPASDSFRFLEGQM